MRFIWVLTASIRWGGAWPSDQEGTPGTRHLSPSSGRQRDWAGSVHITSNTNKIKIKSPKTDKFGLIRNNISKKYPWFLLCVGMFLFLREIQLWTPLPLECQALPSINRKYDQFPPALPQTHSPMAAKSIPNIMKFNKILFPLSHLSHLRQPPVMLNS